jgi:hypothetical protein
MQQVSVLLRALTAQASRKVKLALQVEVEAYLSELEKKWDELQRAAKPANPELQQRIAEARKVRLAKLA